MQKEIVHCEALTQAGSKTKDLCYVGEVQTAGYRRRREGKDFVYIDVEGKKVQDAIILARFSGLAIPPSWEDVWVSAIPEGHIQATGRDARGRKQYRYHAAWEAMQSNTKFDRMVPFGDSLPELRKAVERDLGDEVFSYRAVIAFAVRLMEETLVRVGNREYVRQNQSYGITTLRHYHVKIEGQMIQLKFKGKGGKERDLRLWDRRLARLAKLYQELPGQELLRYEDEKGQLQVLDSADVNNYLRQISGGDFSAKDFRTWGGTINVAVELVRLGPAASESEERKKLLQATRKAAGRLGNTLATCRKYYIHPKVAQGFHDLSLFEAMAAAKERKGLSIEESGVLEFLKSGTNDQAEE